MISVRVVAADSPELLGLHLLRTGLSTTDARTLARDRCGWQLLVTGLSPDDLQALQAIPGVRSACSAQADRGAALLSGRGEELEEASQAMEKASAGLATLAAQLRLAIARHQAHPAPMAIGQRTFEWGQRTFLMGVVNVTPDSFSDGGRLDTVATAVAAGERLAADGADLIDIGGESTRPGAKPVSAAQEMERVLPVVEKLSRLVDPPISVDTTKAEVAAAALKAGASLVNDISGFTFDPEMAPVCARAGAAACAMHIRGTPRTMQEAPSYLDLVGEVFEGLGQSLAVAARNGLPAERILIDPGIGFGKTAEHNLFLLRNLAQLRELGRPILVGASRKSFIGKITGRAVGERLPGSLAVLAAAVLAGADVVRVHDVAESRVAAQVVDAIARARAGGLAFA